MSFMCIIMGRFHRNCLWKTNKGQREFHLVTENVVTENNNMNCSSKGSRYKDFLSLGIALRKQGVPHTSKAKG